MKLTLFFIVFTLQLTSQSWVQLADFPGTERDDGVVFVINNKAYCLTGLDVGFQCTGNGFVFDGSTETWSGTLTLPNGNERQYATGFSYNNYGYILGGINCSNMCLNDFWKYEPISDIWTVLPNFPGTPRQGMCHFIIQDKVYIIGGKLADGTILKDVWEYNFTSANWTQKNDLPVNGIWRGSGFAINTNGYMCYGINNNQSYNHFMYIYNYITDSWTKIPGLTLPDKKYIGTAVSGNGAYLYGGQDSTGTITNSLLIFDSSDNSLLTKAGIPTFGRKGGMAFIINNSFYFTTGVTNTARVKETWKAANAVGLEELKETHTISIYPNPVETAFTISIPGLKNENAMVDIFNIRGEKISSALVSENIDVKGLQAGMYFVTITDKQQVYKTKFVKR